MSTTRKYIRLGVLAGAASISFILVSRFELSQPQTRPKGISSLGNQAWQTTFEAVKSGGVSETAKEGNETSGGVWDELEDEEDDSDYWYAFNGTQAEI